MRRVILLGPQRFRPNLAAALDSLECDERLAVITAGWQEREEEIGELVEHCGREVVALELYRRTERVLGRDEELSTALRERQDELQELQALYRLRLVSLLDAARSLLCRSDGGSFLDEHRRAAIRALRTLDRQHLVRMHAIHAQFEAKWMPTRRVALRDERAELASMVERASALIVAGGHVAVLLNRLRLFDLLPLVGDRPVLAWSAGAMALGERVVLFHDSPPQGPGDAEVFEPGLGLHRGMVPLPDAVHRLDLEDPHRVTLFARRFAPATCVVLEAGSRIDFENGHWAPRSEIRTLGRGGRVRRMRKT